MPAPGRSEPGYSLMEVLVVLTIVATMLLASVLMIRPRTTDSVRSVMFELEGLLMNAENASKLATEDIFLTSQGDWVDTGNGPLVLDARPFITTGASAAANPPSAANLIPGATCRVGSSSECFRSQYGQGSRDHLSAGVDTTGAWYTTALGAAPALNTLSFFNTTAMASFTAAMANPLCTSALNTTTPVVLSGINHSFLTGFSIVVVGLRNGSPVKNGPIGMLVVPAGGVNVYRFFKPDGKTTWGRI